MVDVTEQRRIGDPDPGAARLKRKRLLIAAGVVLVLAVPGIFYFSGAYDSWQDNRSLADTCRGSVDTSEVKELLGVDRVRGHDIEADHGSSPRAGQLHKCSVGAPDGNASVSVSLDWSGDAAGPLHDFGGFTPYGDVGMATPLKHGWEGVLDEVSGTRNLVATVNLPCENRRTDARSSSLLVTVQGMGTRSMGGAAQRARFARMTVKTAQNASKAWDCASRAGGEIERVPDSTAHTQVPQGEARGTCVGIKTAVRESVTDAKAPIENCYVLADRGVSQYRISAFYGPFVRALPAQRGYSGVLDPEKPAGNKDGVLWGSAKCPSEGRALYISTRLPGAADRFDPDGDAEKSALKTFAMRSSKRHGCEDLQLP
ncbi:hypothetical protein OG436_16105 [Streptomyces caniferus]|uniref:Septum formation-related domain-containing protein n=1 Tax=Streptomyces caniferus TaxID=285557 RepID=A0ABZ1VS79_9ACTN|nr:hypothetical protein [Streptomyces caniferus]